MDNGGDILRLCRLCLVKDDVNIPIFEGQGDIRQIFLKISSCLPVKVSREDQLPKKICDGCSYKLDMLYEFWNTTANAEKQLLTWLGEAGMNAKLADAVAQQIKPAETFVKQEAIDPSDVHTEDDDDKSYMFQQKFTIEEDGPSATVTSNEEPPPKRARRTAAVKAQIAMDPESDDDDDSGEPVTKVEDESDESDGDDNDASFADAPSTSADDQPGPSGVGKDGVEAPLLIGNALQPVVMGWTYVLVNQNFPVPSYQPIDQPCDPSTDSVRTEPLRTEANKHQDSPSSCPVCKKVFVTVAGLRKHFKYHEPEFQKSKCSVCSRVVTALTLKVHKERHSKEARNRIVICKVCGKSVTNRTVHMRTHTGNKPFCCNYCGKCFPTTLTLTCHKRTHIEERPFVCQVCDKRFTRSAPLKRHMIHHPYQSSYTCPTCSQNFPTKKILGEHRCQGSH